MNANHGVFCLGVAVNIREGFLDDAEQCDFAIVGHSEEIAGNVDADVKAGSIGKVADVRSEGGGEPGFFKHWRMQKRGDGTDFA
jgi:hypothetical protein